MRAKLNMYAVLTAMFILLESLAAACVFAQGPVAGPGVRLTWQAPGDVPPSRVVGYNIYRADEILGHYARVNQAPVAGLSYEDRDLLKGRRYYYKVTTVFTDGTESVPTGPVGMEAGAAPGTPVRGLPKIEFFTTDALGKVKYLDEEAVFVLNGDPGMRASFDIEGVAKGLPMEELKPGSYKGSYRVPQGLRVRDTWAVATITDADGGRAVARTPAAISMYGAARPSLSGLYAGILESDRVGLNWPKSADPDGHYDLYRDTGRIVGVEGVVPISRSIPKGVTAYIDVNVTPGDTYYYVLADIGADGRATFSENLEVKVPEAGRVSGIESVEEDSAGRALTPGDTLTVTVKTSPAGKAYFTIGSAARDIEMSETGPGAYRGSYTVRDGDGTFKTRVAVSFKDASGTSHFANSATFVSVDAPRTPAAGAPAAEGRKPVSYDITDDIQAVVGRSGRLTAGKTFTVTMTGEPGNKAFFSIGEGIWKVPMSEQPGSPGVYKGQYTVRPGDNAGMSPDPLKKTYLTGYLVGPGGALSDPATSAAPVAVDTTCDIKVELSASSLPADARSQAKVAFIVTDADGEPVRDRRLSVMLEPPPRYTGVVGGGGVAFQPAVIETAPSSIGRLQVDFDELTDSFGRVTATYTSGFAAKTAMLVARDYSTGSVGMGHVTTSITSSVSVTLTDPTTSGGPVTAPAEPVYQLQIDFVPDPTNPIHVYEGFMLSAVPDTLTADGVSRANVIATLTKDGVPVEGKTILFAVSGAGGGLTAPSAVTDLAGRAQVFYIAGTRAGKALVTATEASTGISVTKVITLLADAPAKIYVKAYPDSLPADGASSSRVVVEVADVNNNPTEGVEVAFSLRGGSGSGSLSAYGGLTDFRGACDFIYTAGTAPGVATVDVTAVSGAPSAEELDAALSRVMAPLVYDNYDFTELMVKSWYRSAGDLVGRGEPLAVVGTPLGDMVVYSPRTGTLDRIIVEPGVNVMEGKEIGVVR